MLKFRKEARDVVKVAREYFKILSYLDIEGRSFEIGRLVDSSSRKGSEYCDLSERTFGVTRAPG